MDTFSTNGSFSCQTQLCSSIGYPYYMIYKDKYFHVYASTPQFLNGFVNKKKNVKLSEGMLCNNDLGLYSAESSHERQDHTPITTCNICSMTDGHIS